MSEITPLTKDQLFEKKIAENTGSDYNVGDISDVVPVTKDQSFLKEIALNSAGQSEDITELEEKVTANAEAIEAMVNEYGAKNELPNNAVSDTVSGVTFTVNADKTITANGTATDDITFMLYDGVSLKLKDHLYSGCPLQTGVAIGAKFTTEGYRVVTTGATTEVALIDDIDKIYISIVNGTVVNNLVFKPMIRDARIADPTYVPYAMTNAELTEVSKKAITGRYNSQYDVAIFEFVDNGVIYALYATAGGLTYYKDSTKIWDLTV